MKELPLTNGQVALVDENDYYRLLKYKWTATSFYTGRFYAKNQKHGLLHKFIMREDPNEVFNVTFKNGNTLDCRRENLIKSNSKIMNPEMQIIKKSEQVGLFAQGDINGSEKTNQIISDNISGVKEKIVYEAKYINPEGRVFNFGTYETKEEAQENYDKMIKMIPR
jgi:hypothetical protein